jgi:hypothetical protein
VVLPHGTGARYPQWVGGGTWRLAREGACVGGGDAAWRLAEEEGGGDAGGEEEGGDSESKF